MSISLKTHKLLWGRSGNRCAFNECRHELIADETENDDESIIGDEAHIVSQSKDGPRGNDLLHVNDRDKYDNLVLLCRKHHKIIDDQPNFYTVDKLKEIKKNHEIWIKQSLEVNLNKDELYYATCIDFIVDALDFNNWDNWTSWLFGGEQSIAYLRLIEIEKLPNYIVSRFWPNMYSELENAIYNLKVILNDFLKVFKLHATEESLKLNEGEVVEFKTVYTETFYKLKFHKDIEVYNKLLEDYKFHIALVSDLGLELTRASNLLIEKIRKYIYPKYRDKEGKLLITYGSTENLGYQTRKTEYNSIEKSFEFQYFGLENFMNNRTSRDFYYGVGLNNKYLPCNFKK